MHSKLAGQLSLHDMITSVLKDTREKVAADEDKEKSEKTEKMKKLMGKSEKKDAPDDDKEKKASIIDPQDPDQVEKLASALEVMAEQLEKDASANLGGESHQGGETLSNNSATGGKQPYKKDSSKSHNVPMKTPEKATGDNPGAATAVETDDKPGKLLKYLHAKYPEKGVMKTAAGSVKEMIEAKKMDKAKDGESEDKGEKKAPPFGKKDDKKDEDKEKKSSAVSFIVDKLAEYHGGGETLDSKAESGPKPAKSAKGGNSARKHIASADAAIKMQKVDGKEPQKRMLAEVLTEPAQSKARDSKVHENLRNASKGGVKIAAAKAFLAKIAGDENDPRHEKLKEAMKKMEKKSLGGMGGGAPSAAPSMTTPPMTGGMR